MKLLVFFAVGMTIILACRIPSAAFSLELVDGTKTRLQFRTIENTPSIQRTLFVLEQSAVRLRSGAAFFLESADFVDGMEITVYSDSHTIMKRVRFPYTITVPVRYHISLPYVLGEDL